MSRIKKAKREAIYTKILISGCSGSGKTFSGLRVATGMAKELSDQTGKEQRICLIDTENRRSCYYAKKFDYDILELDKYSPEDYIDAIDDALEEGYKVIVIDTISLEWQFLLDAHSKMSGNSFTNYNVIGKRHEKLLDKILQSDAHFVITCRSKEKYVLEETSDGKKVPKKKGVEPILRDGGEYIMTLSLRIDMTTHAYESMKDNTDLFTYGGDMLTETDGMNIVRWSNDGDLDAKYQKIEKAKDEAKAKIALKAEDEAKKMAEEVNKKKRKQENKLTLDELKSEALIKCKELSSSKDKRKQVIDTIKEISGVANPADIEDKKILEEVLKALEELA